MAETSGLRVVALPQDNQPDPSLSAGVGYEWISREEADRRTRVVERLKAVEGRVSALENQRAENKWWIRTMILFTSVVAIAAGAVVAILDRWLP